MINRIAILLIFSFQYCFADSRDNEIENLKYHSLQSLKILERYYSLSQSGSLSISEAQNKAKAEIKNYKFNSGNYVILFNTNGIAIAHKFKDFEGKNFSTLKDKNGKSITTDAIASAISGNGLIEYKWPKPGERTPSTKLTFSRHFEPWNWIVSVSDYTDYYDDIESRKDFIIAISLLELYKKEHGIYPASASDLAKIDPVLCKLVCHFPYIKLENGYMLNAPKCIKQPSNIRVYSDLIKSTGLKKTNIRIL